MNLQSGHLDRAAIDQITRELREDRWTPRENYPCGCSPTFLCATHRERRAVDHYHPETVRP